MQRLNRVSWLSAVVVLAVACSNGSDNFTPAPAPAPAPAAVAPTITTQPANASIVAGQSATFTVVATGTAPLAYQWQRNGIDVAAATDTSYATPAATLGDSGATFRVVVSNSAGTVTSNSAALTVMASPSVTVTLAAPTAGAQPGHVGLAWTVSGPGAGAITSYRALVKASDAAAYQLLPDTLAGTSGTVTLPSVAALNWAQARVRIQACDAAMTCVDSNEQLLVSVLPATVGYFKASNTGAGDLFGVGFALSGNGNFMAVGACCEDSNATGVDGDQSSNASSNSGAVYIFQRVGGVWTQQAYLKASNAGAGDRFGYSVALDGSATTLVVGAPEEDSAATGVNGNGADNSASNSGAAYVFVRGGSTWTQQAFLKASNTDADDDFGRVVAIVSDAGDTVAIAAQNESSAATGINGNGASNAAGQSGAVYVFARSGTSWSQQAYIKASNTDAGDQFGRSISLSGDGLLAVGAWGEDSNATGVNNNAGQANNASANSGAAYVFGRNQQNAWVQLAYLKASNTGAGDFFGSSVVLSGGTLAVGALGEASSATGVNGDQANNAAVESGAVYVFVESGNSWVQQAYVKASNAESGDRFGFSVALSGNGERLAVGAPIESSNATGVGGAENNNLTAESGAAYVFVRAGGSWSQLAYVKATNTGLDDTFGWLVALSDDGLTLAVGAPSEDGAATGINGDQTSNAAAGAGAVYLY